MARSRSSNTHGHAQGNPRGQSRHALSDRNAGAGAPKKRSGGKSGGPHAKAAQGKAHQGKAHQGKAPNTKGASSAKNNEDTRGLVPSRPGRVLLYGRHAVEAALKNRRRSVHRLYIGPRLNEETQRSFAGLRSDLQLENIDTATLNNSFPEGTPHQDVVLEASPLDGESLDTIAAKPGAGLILMLDQVTDPHNVGACLRSAAALGARALVTQDRHSPGESGALAKSAAGGLEALPWIRVANLSQALETLKDHAYWSVGLDGDGTDTIGGFNAGERVVLVMGSEGKGLRPLVAKHCDRMARIPMTGLVESLNVSVAASVAMFALASGSHGGAA